MRTIKNYSSIALCLLAATQAASASQGQEGHGGLVWACRDSATSGFKPGSVELLDIKEGRETYGLQISKNLNATDEQISEAVARLQKVDPFLGKVFLFTLDEMKRAMVLTPKNMPLEPLPDVALIPRDPSEPDCGPEQFAIYDENKKLHISSPIWSQLGSNINSGKQSIAGLFIHEVLYKMNRNSTGVDRSVETRQMVGLLMADTFDVDTFKRLADEKLPTVSNRTKSNPNQIQLLSHSPVKIIFETSMALGHILFDGRGVITLKMASAYGDEINAENHGGPDANLTVSDPRLMDYLLIDAKKEFATGHLLVFQDGQVINPPNVKKTKGFEMKDGDNSASFILLPPKSN